MGLLPRETIHEILGTAIELMLHPRVLRNGIAPSYLATIPEAPDIGSQLLNDLNQLNRTERLRDGMAPFDIWLETPTV